MSMLSKFTAVSVVLLLASLCASVTSASALTFYVAPNGKDSHPGTKDRPFATFERARDAIREVKKKNLPKGGITIFVRAGTYELRQSFELTSEDSGTADAPIVYRTRKGEDARLAGGRTVTGWQPVTDASVLNRIDPAARGQVLQADLRAMGVTDFSQLGGGFGLGGGPGLELFFQDQPMTLARWPNDGFIKIVSVEGTTERNVRGTKGCAEGKFVYEGDRPRRWVGEKEAWVLGYWFWDWAEQRHRIETLDPEKRLITVAPPYHGFGYRKGQWFYGFNLLSELDVPGEWYLDRQQGILYFWPPSPIEKGKAVVSIQPTLVTMKDASNVTFRGITFEAARGTAIVMSGGTSNRIIGCTLRNLGSSAIRISGGTAHGVVGCDIYGTADGGITLEGGNRTTLKPGGHFAENNHIHHYSRWNRIYRPGIALSGVGNRASHNLIHNAPHMAISFGGNDHVIEFNEIHSVSYESNDAGAIYAGRNWTARGTVIRCNYLHHINGFEGRGCVGVYLDDMYCGTTIASNLFYKVTRAAFVGGGRDNVIENNIFVDCKPAVHVDARALGWAHATADAWIKEGHEKGTLSGTSFNRPPYNERYPQLRNILDDEPAAPKGTVVARNVCSAGKWDEIEKKALPYVTFQDNLLDRDPRFVNAAREKFQLRSDSPAYKLQFKRIPIEKIGLINNENRASWPVSHIVRPMVEPPVKQKK